MLLLEDALKKALTLSLPQRIRRCTLGEAHGKRCASPLHARLPLPLWDQSAMDGFAVRSDETEWTLEVVEVIAAGQWPKKEIQPGQCARIMTGAPLPKGADVVVIQENTRLEHDGSVHLYPHEKHSTSPQNESKPTRLSQHLISGQNIRRKGEETHVGDLLCSVGQVLQAGVLGHLASQGYTDVQVFDAPKVALISTGDEIVHGEAPLQKGQIYGSNQVLLSALIQQAGGQVVFQTHALDTPQSVRDAFQNALDAQVDVILSTGGVSVGDFDPVKGVLADLKAELAFWKVRMKPGKPVAVGRLQDTPFFALPGNPVSCGVGFFLFLWPLFRRALGFPEDQWHLPRRTLTLKHDLKKNHKRAEFMRGCIVDRTSVQLTGGQSSGWVSSLARADVLIELPAEPVDLKQGQTVSALVLPWFTPTF